MDQEKTRKRVRLLKATQEISYKELAETIQISSSSMYNWLHNQYNLSQKRLIKLIKLLDTLEV